MFTMNLTIEQYVKTSETNKHIQKLQKKSNVLHVKLEMLYVYFNV